MNTVFRLALYLVIVALSWLALLVVVATLVHGRVSVWLQARGGWRHHGRHRFRQNGVLGRRVAPSP